MSAARATARTGSRTTARATAKDVARLAKVSQSTVSYVLNDTPGQTIPESTRERVHQAVRELGYTPSSAARALRRGSTETVLLVLPDAPVGATIAQFVEQMSDALDPYGYSVLYRRRRAGQSVERLRRELMPAAIVNLAAFAPEEEPELVASGVPLLATGLDADQPGVLNVPQFAIGRVQAEHLVAQGHRRLGYAMTRDARVAPFSAPRLAGVRQVCEQHGLPAPVVLEVALDVQDAAGAVARWRAPAEPVTAVCAYNDETAFALLAGLRALGLHAPGDLAVIGVDNIPLAPFADPPLTSVDIHIEQVTGGVVKMLLSVLVPGRAGSDAVAADADSGDADGDAGDAGPAPVQPDEPPAVTLVVRESA